MNFRGGERQRVAIARALSVYPPILLADEPTGNLDTATGADILKLIRDLHERLGATVLIVTHDQAVAESCARTIHIRDGKIHEDIRRREPGDDPAAADQLALRAQASAAHAADHGGNRAGRGGVRRHAHGESKRAGGVSRRPSTASRERRNFRFRRASRGSTKTCSKRCRTSPKCARPSPVIEATVSTG